MYEHRQANTPVESSSLDGCVSVWGSGDARGKVPDQYIFSLSDCIIIILMTAVFYSLMAFEMNNARGL